MLKKIGFVTAGMAAGMAMMGGVASAEAGGNPFGGYDAETWGQNGLLNLNNTDILHNVNVALGICDNNINVLGVQVPVEDVANGLNIPVLSPGSSENVGATPETCATAGIDDGGTIQDNG